MSYVHTHSWMFTAMTVSNYFFEFNGTSLDFMYRLAWKDFKNMPFLSGRSASQRGLSDRTWGVCVRYTMLFLALGPVPSGATVEGVAHKGLFHGSEGTLVQSSRSDSCKFHTDTPLGKLPLFRSRSPCYQRADGSRYSVQQRRSFTSKLFLMSSC